ncbi:MAG: DUF4258 domain-containing protein [Bacteroidales bacterium]|nr:DUF4258 domain-containing protein [Bacteroidales bacterium]
MLQLQKYEFCFSNHAIEQIERRGISRETAITAMENPDQICVDTENQDLRIYHYLLKEHEQMFLLRIFVNVMKQPNVIVTIYKTTKIHKYYESKI